MPLTVCFPFSQTFVAVFFRVWAYHFILLVDVYFTSLEVCQARVDTSESKLLKISANAFIAPVWRV